MIANMPWLPAALLSIISFGAWGILTKFTVNYVDSKSALLYQVVGLTIVTIIIFTLLKFKPETAAKGVGFGILTGIANGLGCLFYFMAINKGKVTTVVTMTALYPIVTIALAYLILHETVTGKQSLGVLFALTAIYLFAG